MTHLESGTRLVDIVDYRLNCVVLGSGPPLLVVHGDMGYGHGGGWIRSLRSTP
ncbi:MAG: hypothetical protein QM655_02900 [Nocardioidaceae bacterium]